MIKETIPLKEVLLQASIRHNGYLSQCLSGSEEFSKLLDLEWESKHNKRKLLWNKTKILEAMAR